MTPEVDLNFTQALPKAELHAHLSGSISRDTLHEVWRRKLSKDQSIGLEDPLKAINTGSDGFVDIKSFFPIFDKYIYALCNDVESVKYTTEKVMEDFYADGVRYLELRTTPRACLETGMEMKDYVHAVNETISQWNTNRGDMLEVHLILSIDRHMTAEQAMNVVDIAIDYHYQQAVQDGCVVGIDLCGNPVKGDVSTFTDAFQKAKIHGLGITAHFSEVPASSTDKELSTILSWRPDRLGHCIHVSDKFKSLICDLSIGIELCLSCNVLSGLTEGSFQEHHLGDWLQRRSPIALSTDDVGVFGSPLSNEYVLAAKHFHLSREDIIGLSRQAVQVAFAGIDRMMRLIDEFERSQPVSNELP